MWVDEEVKEGNREKRLNELKKKTIKSLKWKGKFTISWSRQLPVGDLYGKYKD